MGEIKAQGGTRKEDGSMDKHKRRQGEFMGEWSLVALGALDGLSLGFFIRCFLTRQKIRKTYACCFMFNLVVASLTVVTVNWAVGLSDSIVGNLGAAGTDAAGTGGADAAGAGSSASSSTLLLMLHGILWKIPLFVVSYPLNCIWLSEVFDEAYAQVYQRKPAEPGSYDLFLSKGADALIQGAILALLVVQTEVLRFLPSLLLWVVAAPVGLGASGWWLGSWVGFCVATVYESWMYSFYSFGFRVDRLAGCTLSKKILYFEICWMYFFGYGLAPTLLMAYVATLDPFLATVLYFVLLPMHAVLAVIAQPEKQLHHGPLPIFKARELLGLLLPQLHGRLKA